MPYNYYYGSPYVQPKGYLPQTPTRRNTISLVPYPTASKQFLNGYYPRGYERSYLPYYQQTLYSTTPTYYYGKAGNNMFGATKKVTEVTGTKRTIANGVFLNKQEPTKHKQTVRGSKRGLQNKTLAMIDIPFKSKNPIVVAFHDRNEPKKQFDSHRGKPLTKTPLSNSTEMAGVKREPKLVKESKGADKKDAFVEEFNSNVKSFGDASTTLSSFHKLRLNILKRNITNHEDDIDTPLNKNETVEEPKTNFANNTKIYELVNDYNKEGREDNGDTVNVFDDDSKQKGSKGASQKNETNSPNDEQDPEMKSSLSEEREEKDPETMVKVGAKQNSESPKNKTSSPEDEESNKTEIKSEELLQKPNPNKAEKKGDPNGIVEKVKESWNSMAEAAVKLIKGQKDEASKSDKDKLQQSLKLSSKLQEDLLQKDTTGEDIYDSKGQNINDILAPKIPQTLPNDLLHGDWFDTAREPNQKTENDIKMSSDVLSKIAKAKMKGKQPIIAPPVGPESKKQYENRVKSITNLAESTENNMLSMLIQGSLGAAMKKPLDPLKLRNAEIEVGVKNPSEKTDTAQLQKVLSKYNDDFDIFVDKAALNQATTNDGQPMGQAVSSIKTFDALPDNESKTADDVTGSKKNRLRRYKPSAKIKTKRVGKNDDDNEDVLMQRLSAKWKLFKEANKAVLEDTKTEAHQKSHGKSKVSVKNKNNDGKDILNQYFNMVEGKQAFDQVNDFELKQDKRKEKLRSTLNMIGDIEKEIDDIFKKEPLQDPPTGHIYLPATQYHKSRSVGHKKKGKAEIFRELSGTSTTAMAKAQPKGTAQKEYMYLKEAAPPAGFVDSQDKMFTTYSQPKHLSIMGIPGSESYVNEQGAEQQPHNFIAPLQEDVQSEQQKGNLSRYYKYVIIHKHNNYVIVRVLF